MTQYPQVAGGTSPCPFNERQQLVMFDVSLGEIVKTIPLPSTRCLIAGSAHSVYVIETDNGLVQRYELGSWERKVSVKVQEKARMRHAAAPLAGQGPLIISGLDEPSRQGRTLVLDGLTLKPLDMTLVIDPAQVSKSPFEFETQVRWSPNGRYVWFGSLGGIAASLLEAQNNVLVGELRSRMDRPGGQPTNDGLLLTINGLLRSDLSNTMGPSEYWQKLHLSTDGKYIARTVTAEPNEQGQWPPVMLSILSTTDGSTVIDAMGLDEFPRQRSEWDRIPARFPLSFPQDRRVTFVPQANAVITVPFSDAELVVHAFDLHKMLRAAGDTHLFVTSRPAAKVAVGRTLEYQIEVQSGAGGLTFTREAGPAQLTVSPTGLVRWPVRGADMGKQGVIIAIRDAAGKEIFHTFDITVVEVLIPKVAKP
jgi:hypothetical protein